MVKFFAVLRTRNFIYLLLMKSRGAGTQQVPRCCSEVQRPWRSWNLCSSELWFCRAHSAPFSALQVGFLKSLFHCKRRKSIICRGSVLQWLWQWLWQPQPEVQEFLVASLLSSYEHPTFSPHLSGKGISQKPIYCCSFSSRGTRHKRQFNYEPLGSFLSSSLLL